MGKVRTMTSHFVKIQADKRVGLARIAKHDAYLVHEEPDGTLVYEPASAITETERKLLQDTELMTQSHFLQRGQNSSLLPRVTHLEVA